MNSLQMTQPHPANILIMHREIIPCSLGGLPQGRCQLGGEGYHGSSSEVSVIEPTKLYCHLHLACTEKHQLV